MPSPTQEDGQIILNASGHEGQLGAQAEFGHHVRPHTLVRPPPMSAWASANVLRVPRGAPLPLRLSPPTAIPLVRSGATGDTTM